MARRAAGFEFGLAQAEAHKDLHVATEDGNQRVSTKTADLTGHWNTVLGDKELPQSGRSYWEVKIVRKPTEAWEYIGVAEPSADLTVPLTRNKNGMGWFWGSTWKESYLYSYLEMRKEWSASQVKNALEVLERVPASFGVGKEMKKEDAVKQITAQVENHWTGKGTHVGNYMMGFPAFQNGMVVGVDVDMNDGSLAFWADGKYLGVMRDYQGKPVSLKGKKVVPALSVFGRSTGAMKQHTVMEVRVGLEPPARP